MASAGESHVFFCFSPPEQDHNRFEVNNVFGEPPCWKVFLIDERRVVGGSTILIEASTPFFALSLLHRSHYIGAYSYLLVPGIVG